MLSLFLDNVILLKYYYDNINMILIKVSVLLCYK